MVDASLPPEEFRATVRAWLAEHLPASLVGAGGPGREHELLDERLAWERTLASGGWIGLGWDSPYGGRADIERQVIFFEEYARAGGPGRLSHMGEYLLAPTLIAFGTAEQQARFLPPIARAQELWCQGYSEPDAGSDLASVRTTAVLDGDVWRITGQKVWTSLAHLADWCFVLCRTHPEAPKHRGLSFLLVPMRQPGVQVRPIVQLTGDAEFNEVFFDGAVTAAENVVGAPGDGWRVATGTLGFERGVATLGQQLGFTREFQSIVDGARAGGRLDDPVVRDRVVQAWVGLQTLRHHALRTLGSAPTPMTASVAKLLWAPWHQRLGELAVELDGVTAGPDGGLTDAQRLFLFTRADTIYGGSNEIQRNIIANVLLGRS
jgi:alkylation response protein AidB-like acyl-CoA dehydrogenase